MSDLNIKLMLVEKERDAYMGGDKVMAEFLAATLNYIGELEDQVNAADSEFERLENANATLADEKSDLTLKVTKLEEELENAEDCIATMWEP